MEKVIVLGSTEVANLVGIQATLLNKFVERKQYGIEASVRQAGGGRGKERLFGEGDVYGIALVHWLFESGLRSQAIQFALNQVCNRLKSTANDAAATLLRQEAEMLVVSRQPRKAGNAKHPAQATRVCDAGQAAQLARGATGSVLVISVGKLIDDLRRELGGR